MSARQHLAVIVAAIVYFAIGAAWYTILSVPWLAGIGKSMDQLRAEVGPSPLPYIVGFVAIVVLCYALAWFIGRTHTAGAAAGAKMGFVVGLVVIGGALALNYGFEWRPVTLWLINVGYDVIGLLVAGAIIGGWNTRA